MKGVALDALERLARGLPAFSQSDIPSTRLEGARRRDALRWLRSRGYLETVTTGETGDTRSTGYRNAPEIRLPRVTESGRVFLAAEQRQHNLESAQRLARARALARFDS